VQGVRLLIFEEPLNLCSCESLEPGFLPASKEFLDTSIRSRILRIIVDFIQPVFHEVFWEVEGMLEAIRLAIGKPPPIIPPVSINVARLSPFLIDSMT